MDETRGFLKKCPTFQCSFEEGNRGKSAPSVFHQLSQCISHVRRVEQTKAYFHTDIGGALWHLRNMDTCGKSIAWNRQLLLANCSFNDRAIHYSEATVEKDECAEITKHATYKCEPRCTAITMVPGPQKGMFPEREDCPDGVYRFHQGGMVEVYQDWLAETHTHSW